MSQKLAITPAMQLQRVDHPKTWTNVITDEATGLSFCDAPCEMHYNQEAGLPKGYVMR